MLTSAEARVCQRCSSPLPLAGSACPNCAYDQRIRVPRSSAAYFLLYAVGGVLLFAAVAVIATAVYLDNRLLGSEAYSKSLSAAFSSIAVQGALGSDIQVRRPALGYMFPFSDSQFAEWSVGLTGSRGSGHLYGVATQVNGVWDFSRLVFAAESNKEKIDLTPVRSLRLPSVPAKNVYLVPMGLADGESVEWAPAYYKSKLGIDLKVLPSVPLDPKIFDPTRNQLNSDKCIE
ncbi:MAG: cytochrome c oxidase assembly factor Coa1 family protein, partial [Candidatus Sulfotelmatobacter sp.]